MVISADYSGKSDDELLRLATETDSLTPEARVALAEALKNRRLDSGRRIQKFAAEEEVRKHLDDIDIGPLGLGPRGFGKRPYGRFNAETVGQCQEYDATLFAVVSYFPLVPIGTYRFSRDQQSKDVRVLEKKPLDWSQVVWVWVRAVVIVVATPFILAWFLEITRR